MSFEELRRRSVQGKKPGGAITREADVSSLGDREEPTEPETKPEIFIDSLPESGEREIEESEQSGVRSIAKKEDEEEDKEPISFRDFGEEDPGHEELKTKEVWAETGEGETVAKKEEVKERQADVEVAKKWLEIAEEFATEDNEHAKTLQRGKENLEMAPTEKMDVTEGFDQKMKKRKKRAAGTL